MNSLDQAEPLPLFEAAWHHARSCLQAELAPPQFDMWIGQLRLISSDNGCAVIACASDYRRDGVVGKFGKRIADLMAEAEPRLLAVDFIVDPNLAPPRVPPKRAALRPVAATAGEAVSRPIARAPSAPMPFKTAGRILIEDVKRVVALRYAVKVEDLESASRKRKFVWPRQIAMALARELTGQTLPQIARRFARDHSTVLHGCMKIAELSAADPAVAAELAALRQSICSSTQTL